MGFARFGPFIVESFEFPGVEDTGRTVIIDVGYIQ
jgi:hypothetical protein